MRIIRRIKSCRVFDEMSHGLRPTIVSEFTRNVRQWLRTTTKKATPVDPGNRYCRESDGYWSWAVDVDPALLAHKASMSVSAARYTIEAHNGVIQALQEAGKLPKPKPEPKVPAVEAESVKEPVSVK